MNLRNLHTNALILGCVNLLSVCVAWAVTLATCKFNGFGYTLSAMLDDTCAAGAVLAIGMIVACYISTYVTGVVAAVILVASIVATRVTENTSRLHLASAVVGFATALFISLDYRKKLGLRFVFTDLFAIVSVGVYAALQVARVNTDVVVPAIQTSLVLASNVPLIIQ